MHARCWCYGSHHDIDHDHLLGRWEQASSSEAAVQVLGCNVLARLGLDAECYAIIPRKGGVVAVLGYDKPPSSGYLLP